MSDTIIDALITALMGIGTAIFLLLVLRWSPVRRHYARRAVTRHFTAPMRFFALEKPLPRRLSDVGTELEAAGATLALAREVLVGSPASQVASALYLADDRAVLIEVVCGFDPSNPDPAVSCMSQLAGRRGLLVTENLRNAPELDAELLQVFPEASPAQLLAEHRRALREILERGIAVDPISVEAASDAYDWWVDLTRSAWSENGSVYADLFLAHQGGMEHPQLGSVLERGDLDEQLRALR